MHNEFKRVMKKVDKRISTSQANTQVDSEEVQKAEAIRRAFEEQEYSGLIPFKRRELSPDDKHEQYIKKDFPAFIKKLRNELLGLTMEALGKELGVTKNHVAKMESGSAKMGKSVQLLFFDLVEKVLAEQEEQWLSLGEDEVDQLIPDDYKQRRGWSYDKEVTWAYSENSSLIVKAGTPPLLSRFSEEHLKNLEEIGKERGIKKKGGLLFQETMKQLLDEDMLRDEFEKSELAEDLNKKIEKLKHGKNFTKEKLSKLESELALVKQEIKAKEEMLSLKDELIAELRDRIELMKKLTNDKD